MRRGLVISAVVAAVMLPAAPALADTTEVVHGLSFSSDNYLTWLGCSGVYTSTHEDVRSHYDLGPATPPAGRRSLRFDLAGGNAIGSLHRVDSMLGTTVAGISIDAPNGAAGVAYAGYQSPADVGTDLIWVGRTALSEGAGGWRSVDVAGGSYDWVRYDTSSGRPVGMGGAATVARFVRHHGGDGAGFFSIGFGCDGNPFNMDAWRIGSPGDVTTYDLEGVGTTTGISGSDREVAEGGSVVLTGRLSDTGGAAIPNAPLTLEAQVGGTGPFEPVDTARTDGQGVATLKVAPGKTTVYRWRFADSGYADGSVSAEFQVQVGGTPTPPQPPESQSSSTSSSGRSSTGPAPAPSSSAPAPGGGSGGSGGSGGGSGGATAPQVAPSSLNPSTPPSPSPSASPSPSPSAPSPSASPSEPTASATP